MSDLISLGISLAFGVISIGSLSAVVACIIKCYNNDIGDDHDQGSSDEHVTITINELAGINPHILQSISVIDFEDRIECVVCLSELADGDKARVLPSCNHWFHADCIDSWFQSHSTCPICRKTVGLVQQGARQEFDGGGFLPQRHDPSSEPAGFQTNPLPTTNVIVIEDHNSDEASEVRPDLTAVVVDSPAKTN